MPKFHILININDNTSYIISTKDNILQHSARNISEFIHRTQKFLPKEVEYTIDSYSSSHNVIATFESLEELKEYFIEELI